MKLILRYMAMLAFTMILVTTAHADVKLALQIKRDAAGIKDVKSIIVLPVNVLLRFDQTKNMPDPSRVAARYSVADHLGDMLDRKMKALGHSLMPIEAAALAIKERKWTPVDIFLLKTTGSWAAPAETLKNRSKDEVSLLTPRAEMLQTPNEVTAFSFMWNGLPGARQGVAVFKSDTDARPDLIRLKELNDKLKVDAMLICEVSDLSDKLAGLTYRFALPLIYGFREVKATYVQLHCMLVRPKDGAILWEARAIGTSSGDVADRAINVDRQAIEGAGRAVDALLADLYTGNGTQAKKE